MQSSSIGIIWFGDGVLGGDDGGRGMLVSIGARSNSQSSDLV